MSEHNIASDPTPQRWERPLNFPPGHWKKQLPTKYLQLAAHGDTKALQALLAQHPEFLSKRGAHNRTLLWEAVRRGKHDTVEWLVKQGADLDATGCYNSESHVQITPYCAAIYYNRLDIANYLHSHKPTFDIFRAAFLGDQERVIAELSADSILLNAEDPHDNIYFMPLIAFPIVGNHTSLVESLLRKGAIVERYSALLLDLATRSFTYGFDRVAGRLWG